MKTPEKLVAGDQFHHRDGNSRVTLTVTGCPVPGSHGTVRVPVSVSAPESLDGSALTPSTHAAVTAGSGVIPLLSGREVKTLGR